jgi:hypothetical protein
VRRKGGVSVAAPATGSLAGSARIPVRLRVGSGVTSVRVFDGATNLSDRFRRRGGVYSASIPRTLLKPGTITLLVQAKAGTKNAGTAQRWFVGANPSKRAQMSVVTGSAAVPAASKRPGAPYVPSSRAVVPVSVHTRTPTITRLTVNGHRVGDLRAQTRMTDRNWVVSARDGLVAGRNVFRAVSYDKDGNRAVRRWVVNRDRTLPMVEAGPQERIIKAGQWVKLKAGPGKLNYAWRVVTAPKGAKVRLIGANTATPRFKAPVSGVYQVALQATRPGAHAASATTPAEDVTTLTAAPVLPEQGDYIDTGLLGPGPKNVIPFQTLYVNGTGYVYGNSDGQTADDFVQLDPTTLAVTASGTHNDIKPSSGTITIGAWRHTDTGYLGGDQFGSMIWIGTTPVAANGTGSDPGNDTGNPTSNLHGWLQPANGSTPATWTGSDYLSVQTRASSDTASTNTMVISGQSYPVSLAAGAVGGYQLVTLDNSGNYDWDQIYSMTGNATADAATENQMAADINNAGPNSTYLLQGFGTLTAIDAGSKLASTLQAIGGNADVVGAIDGTKDPTGGVYSLISGQHSDGTTTTRAARETSAKLTGHGTLSGLLARDPEGNDYIPLATNPGNPASVTAALSDSELLPLVNSGPSSWDNWVPDGQGGMIAPTPGQKNALADIISQAQSHNLTSDLCPAAPDALRASYCNASAVELANLRSNLDDDLVEDDGNGYTPTDWTTVKKIVDDEITAASNVRAGLDQYIGIFGTASSAGAVDGTAIGEKVSAQLASTSNSSTTNMTNILSALTDMVSVFEPMGPQLTFLSGAYSLMSNQFQAGDPSLPLQTAVHTSQTSAGVALNTAYHAANNELEDMGDYLASDPVKLRTGAALLTTKYALSGKTLSTADNAGVYAARQFLWGTIMAPAYVNWSSPTMLGTNPICIYNSQGEAVPFQNVDASARWQSGDNYWFPALGTTRMIETKSNVGLPKSVTDTIFAKVDPSVTPTTDLDAGAMNPYFALDYLSLATVPVAKDPSKLGPNSPQGCYTNSSPW